MVIHNVYKHFTQTDGYDVVQGITESTNNHNT
jgi:hypothetical protein